MKSIRKHLNYHYEFYFKKFLLGLVTSYPALLLIERTVGNEMSTINMWSWFYVCFFFAFFVGFAQPKSKYKRK